jgi:hypothetical protein
MPKQPKPKPRKPGRPTLPKEEAKSRTVLVRFRAEDVRRIETSAKASNQTVSEWIRCTVSATIGG